MSSKRPAPTKRERARNEQALKELLKVPGNGRCADCNTINPGWASWSVSTTSIFIDPDRRRSAHVLGKVGSEEMLMRIIDIIDWGLPVYTMRIDSSQTRDACFKSQITEFGQLGVGPSRCMKILWLFFEYTRHMY